MTFTATLCFRAGELKTNIRTNRCQTSHHTKNAHVPPSDACQVFSFLSSPKVRFSLARSSRCLWGEIQKNGCPLQYEENPVAVVIFRDHDVEVSALAALRLLWHLNVVRLRNGVAGPLGRTRHVLEASKGHRAYLQSSVGRRSWVE
jgi:hypothetical protein